MSGIGWQDVTAALVVLGALVYLVRRKLRARKSANACGSCAGCAATPVAPTGSEPLVSIGVAPDARARRRQ